jgi:hypothetical protein
MEFYGEDDVALQEDIIPPYPRSLLVALADGKKYSANVRDVESKMGKRE